ncbi:MAG: hypothetical protein AAFR03_01110 [Pseudomonadota bacterium]
MMTITTVPAERDGGKSAPPPNAWDLASNRISHRAARYTPWTLIVASLTTVAYVWEELGEPITSTIGSSGYYPLSTALTHVKANLIFSISTIPLLWALWELHFFVVHLSKDGMAYRMAWRHLTRLGFAIGLSGVCQLILSPVLALLLIGDAHRTQWSFSPTGLALIGIGALLVLVSRLLKVTADTASELRDETRQFV